MRMLSVLLIALAAMTATVLFDAGTVMVGEAANPAVIGGPIVNPGNGHTYYLLASATWSDAEAEAVALGGHLVTINDAAEEGWIWDTFSGFGGVERSLWIGMTDAASEGDWLWISGEPVTFTHWSPGEPNDCGGNEDYGHIFPSWDPYGRAQRWNDILNSGDGGCGQSFAPNGVVEVTTAPTPTPTPAPPAVGGIVELAAGQTGPAAGASDSSGRDYTAPIAAAVAAGLAGLAAGGWYARRRWRGEG